MKKTLTILLSSILLITLSFSSCNIDGTTGILWDVANSKTPLAIQYKQLLGVNGTNLYFRTAKGVERVDSSLANTPVAKSSNGNIIQAAALKSTEVLYITNNLSERNIVNVVDTTDLNAGATQITVAPTAFVTSELAIKNLYANSMILVSGKNGIDKVFELLEYDGTNFSTSVVTFPIMSTDYDLENVIQQTAKEQNTTAPMIVSFVNGDGVRIHYLVDPAGTALDILDPEGVKIANFLYVSAENIYVLTTDGELYHVDSSVPSWTLINSSSKTYEPNAFAFAVIDGTYYHLITKPSSKTSFLHVLTIDYTNPSDSIGSGVEVKSGYAKELALATIVSAQTQTSSPAGYTNLLVATDENGMYDISIKIDDANKDTDTNGSTSVAEVYTF